MGQSDSCGVRGERRQFVETRGKPPMSTQHVPIGNRVSFEMSSPNGGSVSAAPTKIGNGSTKASNSVNAWSIVVD